MIDGVPSGLDELDLVDIAPLSNLMDLDIELATRAARVHAGTMTRAGWRCASCGAAHPCRWQRWARCLLLGAGWSQADVDAPAQEKRQAA